MAAFVCDISRETHGLIHQISSDLRQHSIRRNETVLDGGDILILFRAVVEVKI